MHLLQVGNELSAGDSGDFRTDSTQVFGFTTGFDAVARLDFLAARFTLPCHWISRLILFGVQFFLERSGNIQIIGL